MRGQPFVIVGHDDEGMRIRAEIALHRESATVYKTEDKTFTVFDLDHAQCGLNLVHFCGIVIEEYQPQPDWAYLPHAEVFAFKDRQFFEDCVTSVAVLN